MARPRSEFLGSLGKLFSLFKKVVDRVLVLGGNDENIAQIDSDENLANDIANLIVGKTGVLRCESPGKVYQNEFKRIREKVISCTTCGRTYELGQRVLATGIGAVSGRSDEGWVVGLDYSDRDDHVILVLFAGTADPKRVSPRDVYTPDTEVNSWNMLMKIGQL